ncbi:Coenzyme F420 hydrogenase/dehydrogenase, beta subunit C-terminal domain [Patescibacteria group bacterium]|nr:Coenzyme F420 hydrogenase/dehydrogenase, beta subunit C-terminal domain [Patescibacteria group bacterium]
MQAIRMEFVNGQFLPKIDTKKCIQCGTCLKICPGADIDPFADCSDTFTPEKLFGNVSDSFIVQSKDKRICSNSISGGFVTSLVTKLIEDKRYDSAFVLDFDSFCGKPARLEERSNVQDIFGAAKSKYIPVSVFNVITALKNDQDKKRIVIGTPCQFQGIKNYLGHRKFSQDTLFFVGLFCDKTLNFNSILYFEDSCKKPGERLQTVQFRTKEKHGWPGHVKLTFDSGRASIVDRKLRTKVKDYFQLNRCLYCLDKFNRNADIACGDSYVRECKSVEGKSSVLIRSDKGRDVFNLYSDLFVHERVSLESIAVSQQASRKKDNYTFVTLLKDKEHKEYIRTEQGKKAFKRVKRRNKKIKKGQEYSFASINRAVAFATAIATTHAAVHRVRNTFEGIYVCYLLMKNRCNADEPKGRRDKKNIILTGGNLFNRGSQAMVFTTVQLLKEKYPNKDIYLLSARDYERIDGGQSSYSFKILPLNSRVIAQLMGVRESFFMQENEYSSSLAELKHILHNTAFCVDVSGYSLSSQRDFRSSLGYVMTIALACTLSIPFYIFPQSIGPFDYPLGQKILLLPLIKKYLSWPRKIFVREQEGLNSLKRLHIRSAKKEHDVVLQGDHYDPSVVFKDEQRIKRIDIKAPAVGIVTNNNVLRYMNEKDLLALYKSVIEKLLLQSKRVYILKHSYEDEPLNQSIKRLFSSNDKVLLLPEDFNALEVERIIKQFDYVVASRYHSLVHSYRNGVPAIVLGWAVKYEELMKDFDQQKYLFDVREKIDTDRLMRAVSDMESNDKEEQKKITLKMEMLRKDSFTIIT